MATSFKLGVKKCLCSKNVVKTSRGGGGGKLHCVCVILLITCESIKLSRNIFYQLT